MGFFDLFKPKPRHRAPQRNLFTIQIGDVVSYDERDYIVQQVLTYNEGGYQWFDYQLVDGNDEIWLGVDDDDGIEVGVYREIDLDLEEPIPRQVSHEGLTFKLEEKGSAQVVSRTEYAGNRPVNVYYWDFESTDGDKYLSVEKWGNEIEASVGYSVKPYEIKIFPKGDESDQ